MANLRAAAVVGALAVAGLAYAGRLAPGWLAPPLVGFVALVAVHARFKAAIRRADRAVAYYARGIDRLGGSWRGRGEDGGRFADESHPFAADLDLFGPGSLFERMNTARTAEGEATLAGWLKSPQAGAPEVRARQGAVADLAARLDLREGLDLLGGELRVGLDGAGLVAWGKGGPILPDARLRLVANGLAMLGLIGLALWFFAGTGPSPLLAVVLVDLAFWARLRARVARVLGPVGRRSEELALLSGLLKWLEEEAFDSPLLKTLRDDLSADGEAPSRRIARLAGLVRRVESARNQLVAPFAALLLTGTRLAFAIEAWRRRSGPLIAAWVGAVGAIEAYGSIGAYAYEVPDDPYPDLVEDGPLFVADSIGHPLIEPGRCVPNSLSLGGPLRVLVVSGSNMSGKSTLLRTVGVNAVLAMVGAPVRAEALRMSPLHLGATLRVQDSLQAGASRFYAELTRLRQVVGLAGGSPPLLFLLDEVFSGTNSDDRRVGAEGIVRGLVEKGAIGLVTTHDLALARIAEGLAPRAANVHFSDRFEGDSLAFDYAMKPGVVAHSNALALMRAVGLDV